MMTCKSDTTTGGINSLSSGLQTWQMIYLAGDLGRNWKGVCLRTGKAASVGPEGCCSGEGTTAKTSSTDLQAWKTRCLAIAPLQLRWWCAWCDRDKQLDSKLTNKMPVIPWKTNTGLLRVLLVWPRHLRLYSHQLWRMIFNGNQCHKKYPDVTFKNIYGRLHKIKSYGSSVLWVWIK